MNNALILDSSNQQATVTNFLTSTNTMDVGSLIYGTADGSGSGELGMKMVLIGSSGSVTANAPTLTAGTPSIATANGTVIAANPARKAFIIQNLDDAAVYVRLAAGASSTEFDFVLPACVVANDGSSPAVMIYGYKGDVSIAAATGNPRVTRNEYT